MALTHCTIALISLPAQKAGFHIPQKYLTRFIGHISFSLLTVSDDTQVLSFERTVVIFFSLF